MKRSLTEQLHEITGRIFLRNGIEHTIISFLPNRLDDRYTVKTNRQVFESNEAGIRKILKDLLPVEDEPEMTMEIVPFKEECTSVTNDLRATLLEAIEKVQQDPGYIKQAQAINSLTKTIIYSFQIQQQLGRKGK
ncbi:hypothetical protein EG832_02120 [bacterium]|nr:hypothetical protein [bacterium]